VNRIYLTGFSAGGSGSYMLVRGFISRGRLFAGIIRVAGQSNTQLPDEAVAQTSIWYHIGLNDTPTRVQVARDAYDFLKNHTFNTTATESTVSDTISSYDRTTKTLTKDSIEIVKYTEYPGVGHTPAPAYADPGVFDWLFGQSLDCR
jgi:predicted peptidase